MLLGDVRQYRHPAIERHTQVIIIEVNTDPIARIIAFTPFWMHTMLSDPYGRLSVSKHQLVNLQTCKLENLKTAMEGRTLRSWQVEQFTSCQVCKWQLFGYSSMIERKASISSFVTPQSSR